MNNLYRVFTLFLILLFCSNCKKEKTIDQLSREIKSVFAAEKGDFALAFKNLESGEELLINGREKFHAASTMKTPVMIEVFKQAQEGKFNLTDSILVKNEFYSIVDSSIYSLTVDDDSESVLYGKIGTKRSIRELSYDMIIVSSNLATNLVIDLVDAKKVTQTMRDLGAPDIEVLRGVEDIKAFKLGRSNSTTAFDLLMIFEKLAKGKVINEAASNEMIDILLDQRFNDIIPVHLPETVKVAHKTGSITGVHHDSGIVFLPDGRKYVLVLLSKNLANFDTGTACLAKVSKMIYDFVEKMDARSKQ